VCWQGKPGLSHQLAGTFVKTDLGPLGIKRFGI
jgi:hypothetical protein